MTVGQQGPGPDGRVSSEDDGAPTERVRASSETPRTAALGEVDDRANITAELPPVAPRRQSASDFRSPAPTAPRRDRREPAPTAFRVVVWCLFFVFLFALAGLVTVKLHPDWLSFLRNEQHVSQIVPPVQTTVPPVASTTMSLISSSAKTVAYGVPAASFSVIVRTLPGYRCWTVANSPLTSKTASFAETIPPNKSVTIPLHSNGSVILSASARSLTIVSGSKVLGTVMPPRVGVTYEFTSTSS